MSEKIRCEALSCTLSKQACGARYIKASGLRKPTEAEGREGFGHTYLGLMTSRSQVSERWLASPCRTCEIGKHNAK